MGAFIDRLWKRSFFFHDRDISAAFHTSGQVLTREPEEFKKFPPADAERQRSSTAHRLAPKARNTSSSSPAPSRPPRTPTARSATPPTSSGTQAILATLTVPPRLPAGRARDSACVQGGPGAAGVPRPRHRISPAGSRDIPAWGPRLLRRASRRLIRGGEIKGWRGPTRWASKPGDHASSPWTGGRWRASGTSQRGCSRAMATPTVVHEPRRGEAGEEADVKARRVTEMTRGWPSAWPARHRSPTSRPRAASAQSPPPPAPVVGASSPSIPGA